MRKSAGGLVASFLFGIGVAHAQNALSLQQSEQRTSVQERLNICQRERLQWEAAETWSSPTLPYTTAEPESRPIHIENGNQPPLTLPKLRREWLQPAAGGAANSESTAGTIQPQDERGIEHFVPNSKENK